MSNVLKMARKEFTDLLSNRLMVFALMVYLVVMVLSLFNQYQYMLNPFYSGYDLSLFIALITIFLTDYGSLLAVIIGFFVISSEKRHNTINTLIMKPLYRDTVINGKLVGAAAFLVCLLTVSSFIYIAGLLVVFGGQFGPVLSDALVRLPIVLLFSLSYTMVFFSVSLLFSILIKDEIFALFLSLFFWFTIVKIVPNVIFSGNLSLLIGGGFSVDQQKISDFISLLSPDSIRSMIIPGHDILEVFVTDPYELGKLLLYSFLAIIGSYIAFIRRDIA